MKYLLTLLGIISCMGASAQKNNSPVKTKQILVGFNFSTDYDYRVLKNNGGDAFANTIISSRNDIEVGKSGYTTGLNFCVSLNKLAALEAGIQYSNKGYKTKIQHVLYDPNDPAAPVKAQFIYNYHYIDVPLKLNLTCGTKKIRLLTSAGMTMNFLVNATQKGIFVYEDGRTRKENESQNFDFKKINISPMISAGGEWKMTDKMLVRIEPTFRYGLIKTIDTPVTEHLWNAGINMGCYYRL